MREPIEPKWRRRLELPVDVGAYAFNPTLLPSGEGLLCIYRHVAGGGMRTLRACRLDETFAAHDVYDWSAEAQALGAEQTWFADPRAFRFGDRRFVSFNTGHSESPNGLYLTEISASGRPLALPTKLRKQGIRRNVEKNWGFFEADEKLYCVYSLSPFVVLEVADDGYTRVFASHEWHSAAVETAYGTLRGGASPIRVGDTFYMIVQSHTSENDRLWYTGSLMAFDATPPFRPKRYALEPLFGLTDDERNLRPSVPLNPAVAECFYPSGAAIHGDELLLAYGINDFRSGLRAYSLSALEDRLASAPPKTPTFKSGSHALPKALAAPRTFWKTLFGSRRAPESGSPVLSEALALRSFLWEPELRQRGTPEDVVAGRLRVGNAGDALQQFIATKLFGARGLNTDERGARFLSVGSIAHRMRAGDVIWGSGHKPVPPTITPAEAGTIAALAVRGPLTLDYLKRYGVDVSAVRAFFDPGLLIGELLSREISVLRTRSRARADVLYLPHYSDTLRFDALYRRAGRWVSTMDQDVIALIAEILAAELVVASSLHGVIFAEALGVPAILHRPPAGEHFSKYIDYYEGTDRPRFPILEDGDDPKSVRALDPPRPPAHWRETIPSLESLSHAGVLEPVIRFAADGACTIPKASRGAGLHEAIIDLGACFDGVINLAVKIDRPAEGALSVLYGDTPLISLPIKRRRTEYALTVKADVRPSEALFRVRLVGSKPGRNPTITKLTVMAP